MLQVLRLLPPCSQSTGFGIAARSRCRGKMRIVTRQDQVWVEHFDSLLEWLDPDRERADERYQTIREGLIKIFTWNRCSDAESLADETLNRVMLKAPEVRRTYSGDPALYFHAVAKNVFKEHQRARSVEQVAPVADNQETSDIEKRNSCFERCLSNLSSSNRELVVNYYSQKRTNKLSSPEDTAEKLDVSANQLRLRVYRIRQALKTCIQTCLEEESRT